MRILAQEQRPRDPGLAAIFYESLAHRQDVRFIETTFRGAAPVARSAKRNLLRGFLRVGLFGVIGRDEARDVGEKFARSGLTGKRMWHGDLQGNG
jgi:hypothetical protein